MSFFYNRRSELFTFRAIKVMPESCGISSLTTPQNHLHLSSTDREESITRTHINHIYDTVAENGPLHPAVADSQNALGLIYHHVLHEEQKSFSCHLAALRNLLICYQKPQHRNEKIIIQISITIHDLGNVHWAEGDLEKAIDSYREALGLLLGIGLTASHPRCVSLVNRLMKLNGEDEFRKTRPIIKIEKGLILSKRFCSH